MTLYRRWITASVGAALAAYLITLPIYRHAAALDLGDRFSHWQAIGSVIELVIYVAVTYWALAPEFPKLKWQRYAAWTILPTLVVLVVLAMVQTGADSSGTSAQATAGKEAEAFAAVAIMGPIMLLLAWGIFSLQWLSLSEAAEGYRPWVLWSVLGMVASIAVSALVEQLWGGTPFAEMKTAGQQLAAYLSAVAMSSAFGIVSGFGVAQLREKV